MKLKMQLTLKKTTLNFLKNINKMGWTDYYIHTIIALDSLSK